MSNVLEEAALEAVRKFISPFYLGRVVFLTAFVSLL